MLNCVLIGYGYWGPKIADTINNIPHANLLAVWDKDIQRLVKVKNKYPNIQTFNIQSDKDLDVLLQDESIDAVIIATPANTHFAVAAKVLEYKKNIFIEKPLAISLNEAKKIKDLADKAKVTAMVGHTFEYNPAIIQLKKIIDSGEIGKIFYIYLSRLNLGQIRGDVNALWNLAPHDVSIANYLLGGLPIEVSTHGLVVLPGELEDVAFIHLKYPNNIWAQIHVSWIDPSKVRKVTVVGSKKMAIFDDLDTEMPLKIYDKNVQMGDVTKGWDSAYKVKLHSGDIYAPQIDSKNPLTAELEHFFECINQKKKPRSDLENGLNVVKILESCQTSLKNNGDWIKIQPSKNI